MKRFTLQTLEFQQIKELVSQHASSFFGKEHVMKLQPESRYELVKHRLAETGEALDVLRLKGDFSFPNFYDIREYLKRLLAGGYLDPEELLAVADTIRAGRRIRSTFKQIDTEQAPLTILREYIDQISPLNELELEIQQTIDDYGQVRNEASPSLRMIRRKMEQLRENIQNTLQQMLRNPSIQKQLQESIVTQRFDRYVIPVKQEYRGSIDGIVHDQSSSGATLFIEPAQVVSLNNQLREQELAEEQEIERILREVSQSVLEVVEPLAINVDRLGTMDVIFAKAQFGRVYRGICPILSEDCKLRLKKARHPLIPADQVVPIDVNLDDQQKAILITGPNTGGKTVSLKTVGLFALMTQTGFPITAEEGSIMPVYSGVFADIGDEQSIEQNLSTFSSHMTHIISILERIDEHSLVLLDELGAGTDPAEGAALAISILEQILSVGASLVATTHYSELKSFAHTHPQVVNASVEFNVATLSPTYRLMIGVPGQSNAFHICRRLGLAPSIIERAKNHLSTEDRKLDEMIHTFADEKQKMEYARQEAEHNQYESEQLLAELKQKLADWDAEKKRLKDKARQEANWIIANAEREVEQVRKELRQISARQATSVKEHELTDLKSYLHQVTSQQETDDINRPSAQQQVIAHSFSVGDVVRVSHIGQVGTIVEQAGDKQYFVQIGMMKMKVNANQLTPEMKKEKKAAGSTMVRRATDSVPPELDLRGEMVEEAVQAIDHYLDQAIMSGYKRVSIIHGKGTGALRNGVQKFLQQHRQVKKIRLGTHGEGGSGVTIVELE
ncbi:DNA mismatch repair protein MutS2 [Seinonella peptonophila]|uniref:Endonuclease MutS2 n=1 Tax=Seinonella peptonophila TaxID=112248 RepID=A0A1M4U5J1_9BACL|nr:endonuclease MutS2 [Seinonella peptonophila]SHE51943.1 DNA mismatch repair protein MutS2 [Seinonella peptonophila]